MRMGLYGRVWPTFEHSMYFQREACATLNKACRKQKTMLKSQGKLRRIVSKLIVFFSCCYCRLQPLASLSLRSWLECKQRRQHA